MIVIGIDPGSRKCGWGLIKKEGNKFHHLEHGVIVLNESDPLHSRLSVIFSSINDLIKKFNPSVMSVEKTFVAKNVSSALILGQARGAVLVAGGLANLAIAEYSPTEIKLALIGYGLASKLQIQKMVKTMLGLRELPDSDAADALAVGICHLQQSRLSSMIKAGAVKKIFSRAQV